MNFHKHKRVSTVIAGLLGVAGLYSILSAAAIPVTSVTKDAGGVTFAMTPGSMRIDVCTDGIIRVRYSNQSPVPVDNNMSFLVTKTWSTVNFNETEAAGSVTIATAKLQIKVDKTTGAVAFLDASGNTVLQEPVTGGKSLTPTTIAGESTYQCEQIWNCPPGEALYGLGSMHGGFVNFHGMPEYLHQENTHISIPMIISNKGYGILWASASKTYFNLPDQKISGGTFTTSKAGDYVFLQVDGGTSGKNAITVNGTTLNTLDNTWHSSSVSGKIALQANASVSASLTGGGTLYGGPLHDSTKFTSRSGQTVDYYFFYGPSSDEVIAGYRLATGAPPLFAKGAYGYIACKAQYNTQTEILDAATQFRNKKIPVDIIVQDWNYWAGGWNSMVFRSEYPNPKQMVETLHQKNYLFMISVWSKTDGGSAVDNALTPYKIAGAPYYDSYDPQARSVYWSFMNNNLYSLGVDAFWQDADEPEGCNIETAKIKFGSAQVGGKDYANAYGMFVCKTVYEGCRSANPNKRVCILSRSSFAGNQRFAAMSWNGDIGSNWDWYQRSIPAGLNFGMAGIPYWTTDIGGFFRPGNDQTDPGYNELLTRWIEYGTFCPIFRMHGYNSHVEIYNYLQATQNAFMIYDNLRHRLLPYIYSLASMVTNNGYTMMRGLAMDFPGDASVLNIGDQFMFGPAFLVNPVTTAGATSRNVYLPSGTWTNFWTGQATAGGQTVSARAPRDTMPLFVRAGSIVPMGPEMQYAGEKKLDTIELRVYPGANGSLNLYEDDDTTYNYESGKCSTIPITYIDNPRNVIIGTRSGSFTGMAATKVFKVVYVSGNHGAGESITAQPDCLLTYTGTTVSCNPVGIMPERTGAAGVLPAEYSIKSAVNKIALPDAFSGKTKAIRIYDCSGRMLHNATVKKNMIDLRKDFGLPAGVYFVKARVIR